NVARRIDAPAIGTDGGEVEPRWVAQQQARDAEFDHRLRAGCDRRAAGIRDRLPLAIHPSMEREAAAERAALVPYAHIQPKFRLVGVGNGDWSPQHVYARALRVAGGVEV